MMKKYFFSPKKVAQFKWVHFIDHFSHFFRIQNMKMVDGKPEYKGAMDVIIKVAKKEGFFKLWKGFTPYYFRLGPHTVLTFIFLEQMNANYKYYVLGDTTSKGGGL